MHQIPGDNKNFRLVLYIGQTKFKAENVESTYNCLTPDLFSHDLGLISAMPHTSDQYHLWNSPLPRLHLLQMTADSCISTVQEEAKWQKNSPLCFPPSLCLQQGHGTKSHHHIVHSMPVKKKNNENPKRDSIIFSTHLIHLKRCQATRKKKKILECSWPAKQRCLSFVVFVSKIWYTSL